MTDKKCSVALTAAAIQAVKGQLEKRNTPNARLRLGMKGGGCSGFSYLIKFDDNEPSAKDFIFEFDGLQVVIDPKSAVFLNGTVLDWENSLMKKGFKFINPNVKSACGCGHSVNF